MLYVALALALVVVAAMFVLARRRVADGLAPRFLSLAQRHGWRRLTREEAARLLEPFPIYLQDNRQIEIAVGGDGPAGPTIVAAVGSREPDGSGRPFILAAVVSDALEHPPVDLDPRAVRTVRLVANVEEVVVDDARLARGWRITSPDPVRARELLDHSAVAPTLAEVLHRPIPWFVAVRLRPGGVAVHLVRPEEVPGDTDDLERLVAVAQHLARTFAFAR